MPVDPAFGSAGNFRFVELLLEPAGITGWKLHPSHQNNCGGKVRLRRHHARRFRVAEIDVRAPAAFCLKSHILPQQRYIAEPALGSAVYLKSFGPFEGPVNEWRVDLKTEP